MVETATAPPIATIDMDKRVMPFAISQFCITEGGPEFVSSVFISMCLYPETKLLTTTVYIFVTNRQKEE